jgi:hypothetical protein
MAGIPPWLLNRMGQDVSVEPYAGAGAYGPTYDPPATVRALVEHKRKLVRGKDGQEVVSETTIRMQLDVACPVDSRVTLSDGTKSTVLTAKPIDGGTLPVPSHLEVTLT